MDISPDTELSQRTCGLVQHATKSPFSFLPELRVLMTCRSTATSTRAGRVAYATHTHRALQCHDECRWAVVAHHCTVGTSCSIVSFSSPSCYKCVRLHTYLLNILGQRCDRIDANLPVGLISCVRRGHQSCNQHTSIYQQKHPILPCGGENVYMHSVVFAFHTCVCNSTATVVN